MIVKCFSKTCGEAASVKAEFQSGNMALYCAVDAAKFRTTHNSPMPPADVLERVIYRWPLLATPVELG